MAMQKLLLSDEYLSDADIKRLLMDETTFGGNNVHEGGLMSNQLIANKPTIELLNHQNGGIPRQNHPRPILGPIGLSRRVTQYQKIICSSNRVTSCRVTGICRTEPHPILCQSDVRVTEIVRDHVITTVSTREHIFISNRRFVFPNQSIFRNRSPTVVNQVTEANSNQTPTKGPKPSNLFNFNEFQSKNNDGGDVYSSPFHAPFPKTKDQAIPPNGRLNPNPRGHRLPESKAPPPVDQAVLSHLQKNHGAYKCLKCGEAFITTQCYATHMTSHYQSEMIADRLKSQASKCHQNRNLGQSSYGSAVVPSQSLKMTVETREDSFEGHIRKKPKMTVKTEAAVKKE